MARDKQQKGTEVNQTPPVGGVSHAPAPRSWADVVALFWPKRYVLRVVVAFLAAVVVGSYLIVGVLPEKTKQSLLEQLSLTTVFSNKRPAVAFLAGDFVVDLEHPFDRATLTRVDVQVAVSQGSVVPLRKADLISFEYDHSRFDDAAVGRPALAIVTPSSPVFSPDQPSRVISLDFDSHLVPRGEFTSTFRPGDRQLFGKAVVRMWFSDQGQEQYEDVPIPLVFKR